MLEAIKQAKVHREEFLAFDARVREQLPAVVEGWEQMLDVWMADNHQPCPYTAAHPRM